MECDREMINMYLDGMLHKKAMLEVEGHLNSCKDCQEYFSGMIEMFSIFPTINEIQVPIDFSARVMYEIIKSHPKPKTPLWIPLFAIITLIYTQLSMVFGLTIKDTIEIINLSVDVIINAILYFSKASQIIINIILAMNTLINAIFKLEFGK